jgi:hypothetical protein
MPYLLVCGAVLLAYGPAVPNFFTSDDLDMLSGDASDLFSPASGFGRFMPLAAAAHRIAAVAFGLNPLPVHTAQLALHAACTLLVFVLVRQLATGGDRGAPSNAPDRDAERSGSSLARCAAWERGRLARPAGVASAGHAAGTAALPGRWSGQAGGTATGLALAAALLFALYPRHHQVVMWFGAISIGLAGALSLATAALFLRAWRRDARAGWAAAATYAAALLAHESAVVLPLLLAALALYAHATSVDGATDGWRSGSAGGMVRSKRAKSADSATGGWEIRGWASSDVRAAPAWLWAMLLASAAHLALLAWAYRARAAAYPDSGYRFLGLGGDLLAAPLRYAAQLLVPPPWTESLALGVAGVGVGVLALGLAAGGAWRGGALVRLGLAWTALAAAPFVLFGIYGVTDRYYYLPSVGLAIAGAAALGRLRRWRAWAVAAYAAVGLVLLAQVAGEWRQAGASVRDTMDYLADWAAGARAAGTGSTAPEAAAFVGVPFKRGETWPASQVYVFSTGLVGAAHLATGWPSLQVSYVFADEYPALGAALAALPPAPGPLGLSLFALDAAPPADRTESIGAALPELARLRWHGASRTPIDWGRYTGQEGTAGAAAR